MKSTLKILVAASLLAFTAACSSSDPVPDEAPVADMPDELAFEEEQEPEVEVEQQADPRETARAALQAAADGAHRSEEDRARNQYRNPVETLDFFGFEPGQTVVEIWPGRGWYTGVLAPALGEHGTLRVGIFAIDEDDPEDYRTMITGEFLEWVEAHSEALGNIEMGTLDPPEVMDLGEPATADLVVSFRNVHNMYNNGTLDDVLVAVHTVLKPGGVFGVVQHRAPEGADPAESSPKGYLSEQFVIETIEAAGFSLENSAEINANPADTADHPDGVWSLPPSLRGGEDTAEHFRAIGESDRMTLRFVKTAE